MRKKLVASERLAFFMMKMRSNDLVHALETKKTAPQGTAFMSE